MTSERWKQVRNLFDAVLDQPPEKRAAYLGARTAGDPDLRREVEDLLSSYQDSDHMLTQPAISGLETLLPAMTAGARPTQPQAAPASPSGLADTSAMVGRRVGPYKLLRKIGSGGMGTVFVAARDDREFEQRVAIKLVRPGMNTGAILQRFLQERRVLAGLEHPNIARLLDGGTSEDGLPYLVMEYVEGTPIDRYADEKRLNITERVKLFRTVCDAVHYAHKSLVVHRDIKPVNILVTPDGTAKLLDFGIAKLLGPDSVPVDTGLTIDSAPMTPEYASPEQVQSEAVTTASDVYALGVLLYRLVTGRLPYRLDKLTPAALFRAITAEEPQPASEAVLRQEDGQKSQELAAVREGTPEKLRRRLQGDLDVILQVALRKDPARRYASAERLADDLGRHLDGFPVTAQRDTLAYRAGKFVRRHTAGVALSAAAAVALVAATVVSMHYARVAGREKAVAENRFRDVRDLARFVLLDFDDAIRAGRTPARKLLVTRALDYLNRLSAEAAGDPSLQRDVVEGYLKIGGIQGDIYTSNVGDSVAALVSYHKALGMAEQLARTNPGHEGDAILLAKANQAVGDLMAQSGDRKEAMPRYERARVVLEEWYGRSRQGPAAPILIEVLQSIGFVKGQMGDAAAALQAHTRAFETAREFLDHDAGNERVRRLLAGALQDCGKMLSRLGRRDDALSMLVQAQKAFDQILEANPRKPLARREAAVSALLLGDALTAAGRAPEAVLRARQALDLFEDLRREDPQNRQYQRDTHLALGRLADLLQQTGQLSEAREATRRALDILQPLVDAPDPALHDLHHYVWIRVTTPFADLRDPRRALGYAQKLVDLTKGTDPAMLDALARAHFGAGDKAMAVQVERRALALLPPAEPGVPPSALRKELEENLARFER